MAYSTDNPPSLLVSRTGGGMAIWHYNSADASTVVDTANYISNADDLGMKVGDLVFQTDLSGGTVGHIYFVNAVTAGGGCDLVNGTAITATDTD